MSGNEGNLAVVGETAEMPRYQSHKKVWVLKIANVEIDKNENIVVTFENPAFAPQTFSPYGKPTPEPGWYLVKYDDGYVSFSPAKAFEEGYSLIQSERS